MLLPENLQNTQIVLDPYFRRSSDDDSHQIESIPSQEMKVMPLVQNLVEKHKNIKIGKIFKSSHSAKEPNNPDFMDLLQRLKDGESNAIACYELTRLSRNPIDSGELSWLLQKGVIKFILTPQRIYLPEDNALIMSVEFGMANQFIRDLSRNVKRGLQRKAEKGWLPSGAKPGYMNDKYAEKGNKTWLKDPKRFDIVKRAWKTIIEGTSPLQVLEKLNDEWGYRTPKHKKLGGKPMARSQFYRMLHDPFYYGEYEYPERSGNWYHGQHEPMIIKEEFDYIQAILGGSTRLQKHNYTYTGTMRCGECGASISGDEKWQIICTNCKYKFDTKGNTRTECPKCQTRTNEMTNPKVLHYIYYCCTKKKNPNCSQRSIEVKALEEQIGMSLDNIQINNDFTKWTVEVLNEWSKNETVDRNAILNSQEAAYNDCIKRIDNLVSLKISPQNTDGSLLSDIEFSEQKAKLLKEKTQLEEQIKKTGERVNKWLKLSVDTFNFTCYAKYWFENGDPEDKKIIFAALGANLILMDRKVHVDNLKPFEWIAEVKKEVPQISTKSEPNKKAVDTSQTAPNFSEFPTLLPKPRIIINELQFGTIMQTFQNLSLIGELRERWGEIKKLQNTGRIAYS